MARLPRFNLPGFPQHVIQRGGEGRSILFDEDDYQRLWNDIAEAAAYSGCAVHAYVLMPDHFHLLATPSDEDGIGRLVQNIGRRYVGYFNGRYERKGPLWGCRYRATVIDPVHYLLPVSRYIETNVVRAGLAPEAGDYAWSSFWANALGEEDDLLTPHPDYLSIGSDPAARCRAYADGFDKPLSAGLLQGIRDTVNKGWVLGDDAFCSRIEDLVGRRARPLTRGGDRRSQAYRESRLAAG